MSNRRDVVVLVGSLRRESFSRKVANALIALAPPELGFEVLEIGQLPYYNQDLDGDTPPADWRALRERIRASDAVLFVTPEYNRSIPGVLKNAIDVASRPHGKNALDGKPGAVVGVSPGAIGAFGANHHLRQCLAYLNVPTLAQPEMYLGDIARKLDAAGALVDPKTREFLEKFLAAFQAWIEKVAPKTGAAN